MRQAASLHELWGVALFRLGPAANDTRLVRQAAEHLLQSLELAPGKPAVHYNLACAYTQLRQFDRALGHLELGFTADPQGRLQASAQQDPDLEPLRRTDAFISLLRRHGRTLAPSRGTVSER